MIRNLVAAVLFALLPTTAFAGAVGGPQMGSTQVKAEATDAYVVQFEAGQSAEVAIVGDGDTDLDLYIYDENGNLVASDLGSTDSAYVSWTPKWTGAFRIEVKNRGSVYNEYAIVTN